MKKYKARLVEKIIVGVVIFYTINFKTGNKVIYERRFEENKKARIQLFKKIAPRQKKHLVQKS